MKRDRDGLHGRKNERYAINNDAECKLHDNASVDMHRCKSLLSSGPRKLLLLSDTRLSTSRELVSQNNKTFLFCGEEADFGRGIVDDPESGDRE